MVAGDRSTHAAALRSVSSSAAPRRQPNSTTSGDTLSVSSYRGHDSYARSNPSTPAFSTAFSSLSYALKDRERLGRSTEHSNSASPVSCDESTTSSRYEHDSRRARLSAAVATYSSDPVKCLNRVTAVGTAIIDELEEQVRQLQAERHSLMIQNTTLSVRHKGGLMSDTNSELARQLATAQEELTISADRLHRMTVQRDNALTELKSSKRECDVAQESLLKVQKLYSDERLLAVRVCTRNEGLQEEVAATQREWDNDRKEQSERIETLMLAVLHQEMERELLQCRSDIHREASDLWYSIACACNYDYVRLMSKQGSLIEASIMHSQALQMGEQMQREVIMRKQCDDYTAIIMNTTPAICRSLKMQHTREIANARTSSSRIRAGSPCPSIVSSATTAARSHRVGVPSSSRRGCSTPAYSYDGNADIWNTDTFLLNDSDDGEYVRFNHLVATETSERTTISIACDIAWKATLELEFNRRSVILLTAAEGRYRSDLVTAECDERHAMRYDEIQYRRDTLQQLAWKASIASSIAIGESAARSAIETCAWEAAERMQQDLRDYVNDQFGRNFNLARYKLEEAESSVRCKLEAAADSFTRTLLFGVSVVRLVGHWEPIARFTIQQDRTQQMQQMRCEYISVERLLRSQRYAQLHSIEWRNVVSCHSVIASELAGRRVLELSEHKDRLTQQLALTTVNTGQQRRSIVVDEQNKRAAIESWQMCTVQRAWERHIQECTSTVQASEKRLRNVLQYSSLNSISELLHYFRGVMGLFSIHSSIRSTLWEQYQRDFSTLTRQWRNQYSVIRLCADERVYRRDIENDSFRVLTVICSQSRMFHLQAFAEPHSRQSLYDAEARALSHIRRTSALKEFDAGLAYTPYSAEEDCSVSRTALYLEKLLQHPLDMFSQIHSATSHVTDYRPLASPLDSYSTYSKPSTATALTSRHGGMTRAMSQEQVTEFFTQETSDRTALGSSERVERMGILIAMKEALEWLHYEYQVRSV